MGWAVAVSWSNATVKLGDLKPWSGNPRAMTKRQAQRLLKSWDTLGQFQTIAIGPGGEVYDGHQRLNALLAAHGPQYQVEARQSDRPLDDSERSALTIAANVPAGNWDWGQLAGWDTAQLQEWGMDADTLKAWNSDAANLATMLEADAVGGDADADPQVDRAAELNEVWQVKTGDLWRIGEHRLLCGDSTKREDVERVMGGEKADCVLTDPPYCSGGFQEAGKKSGSIGTRGDKMIANDTLSTRGYISLIKSVLGLSDCGVSYIFTDWRMWVNLFDVCESSGFGVRNMVVWDKQTPGMGVGWRSQHELIMVAMRVTHPFDPRKAQGNVIQVDRTGNVLHATEKPVDLLSKILDVTDMATVIYDPFAGSGSTGIACENLHRKARMIEISPNYCAVILQRFTDAFPGIAIERLA